MGGFSQYAEEQGGTRWRPIVIAVAIVAIIGAVIWMMSRDQSATPAAAAPPAYAGQLQTTDLHLSTAENFVGGRVTYLEGKIINAGDKTVTGADVEVVFRNTLGEIVDRQTQPLYVQAAPLGNPDWVALSMAPLGPGKTAEFRMTFEHISADWNQGYPELRFVSVTTK